jgi:signal transduction histidine kinase
MFASALASLKKLSPAALLATLASLAFLIGYLDFLTGIDTTFSAVYLFPIGAAAWLLNRTAGYGLAILSSILWVSGDIGAGAHYASLWVPAWNVAARFALFSFAVMLISEFRTLHADLEKRAAERAAKLIKEIALRERLQQELLHISEREQERVGHDIHDSLCQHLTGTALAAEVVAESLQSKNAPERDDAARVVELIEEGISLARNLARGLSAVEVSHNGLMGALTELASSTGDLFNVSCRFECPESIRMNDPSTAAHLYRIAQEAVGNAIKHGEAKHVIIRLEHEKTGCVLRVIDDGKGLPPTYRNGRGMGLRIMNYRSDLIGARLAIHRRSPKGTELSCSLALDEAAQ